MRRKYLAVFLTVTMMVAVALTGCGSSDSADSSTAAPQETTDVRAEKPMIDEDATYGKITKVDGDVVTLELMTRSNMNKDSNMDRNQSKPEGSFDPQSSGAPEPPQGSGEPDGQVRRQNGGGGFTSTGETLDVTITDQITIQKAQMGGTMEAAELADLTEDSMVQLTMDGDTVTAITIQGMRGEDQEQMNQNS